jgi:Dullard-like phosphatase family protein
MVNTLDIKTKPKTRHSADLNSLITDLKIIPVSKKESSLSTISSFRQDYPNYKKYHFCEEPYHVAQKLMKSNSGGVEAQMDTIDSNSNSNSGEPEEENSSVRTIDSKRKDELWNQYFDHFYIESVYNTVANYTSYVESCLKLICLLPQGGVEQQISEKAITLERKTNFNKTLILDLDETLVHSDFDYEFTDHDVSLNLNTPDEDIIIPLFLRPGLKDFLTFAKNNFELVLFTSSCKEYADTIINYLDPSNEIFSHRIYRDSCVYIEPGIYIKDLRIFANKDLKDMVIIDNCIISFANQLDNGILVSSFYQTEEESILNGLIGYLNSIILNCDDVREKNRECLKFTVYKEELYKLIMKEIVFSSN